MSKITEIEEEYKSWECYSKKEQEDIVKELYHWQYSNTNSFSNTIFSLLQKARGKNLEKLRTGFNLYFLALQKWYEYDHWDDLFTEYGLRPESECKAEDGDVVPLLDCAPLPTEMSEAPMEARYHYLLGCNYILDTYGTWKDGARYIGALGKNITDVRERIKKELSDKFFTK